MNILVYLMFGAGIYLGVVLGSPEREENNRYDEMANAMIVAAIIFAVVDTYLTIQGFLEAM